MCKLNYAVYSAEGFTEDRVAIYPNDIAGGLGDYHAERAEVLSQVLAMPVLAYERPYSTDETGMTINLGLRRNIARNHATLHSKTAEAIAKILQRLVPDATVIALGHSAGASEVIGVTASEVLPIRDLFVTDPAGMRKSLPVYSELIEYGLYQLFGETDKPVDQTAYEFTCQPSTQDMAIRVLHNIATYGRHWRDNATLRALHEIATTLPSVSATVVLPAHTFTAGRSTFDKIVSDFANIRPGTYQRPFNVVLDERGYHSTYDNPNVFGAIALQHLNPSCNV